ncbi:lysis protein [Pseudomonas aeruginosa]|nr:lysis protein [Pseudomonas aeruginosa]
MGILGLLRSNWFWIALIAVLYSAAVVIHGSASYDRGYATGRAEGDAALLNLQLQHTNERAQSLQDSLVQYKQQVARAAPGRGATAAGTAATRPTPDTNSRERIARMYRPPTERHLVLRLLLIPRCVFTRGWVRDFNTALGAGLPAAGARAPLPPALKQRPGPPAGSDAELLESGVTPADILAFAQDYGAWSLRNLAQLNALLEQGE